MKSANIDLGMLLWEASQKGIDIFLDNGRLQVKTEKGHQPDNEMLQKLRDHKQDIIAFLGENTKQHGSVLSSHFSTLKPMDPRPSYLPLSSSQHRLWLLDKLEGTVSYHIPFLWQLQGEIDLEKLDDACKKILQRHEILRTVYREVNGMPYQFVTDASGWHLQVEACVPGQLFDVQAFIDKEVSKPFDLTGDAMLRAKVVTSNGIPQYLLLVVHHIAFDDWSLPIVFKELQLLYGNLSTNDTDILEPLPIQYSDYSVWEESAMSSPYFKQQLDYWTEKLSDTTLLELPQQSNSLSGENTAGNTVVALVPEDLTASIKHFCKEQQTTLFTTLLAAYQAIMHLYSGKEEMSVGIPVANRPEKIVQELVGYFSNTIVVKSNLSVSISFKDFLQQIKATLLEAYEHQNVPYEKIVEVLNQQGKVGAEALFNSMFVITDQSESSDVNLGNCTLQPVHFVNKTAKFDLILAVSDFGEKLELAFQYKCKLYDESTIVNFSRHFVQLLEKVISSPAIPVYDLDIRTDIEKKQVQTFNSTFLADTLGYDLITAFERQVTRTPDNIAIVFGYEKLTYQLLNEQINQFANYLLRLGIGSGKAVGICLERSVEMIVSAFAVLKTGAMYVPIDPNFPVLRVEHMIEEATVDTVITDYVFDLTSFSNKPLFDSKLNVELIIWEEIRTQLSSEDKVISQSIYISPQTPAYVLYTSGTTGRPKAIAVTHQNVTKLALEPGDIAVFEDDRVLQWSNFTFDGSVYDIYNTLLNGATLYLISSEEARDTIKLSQIIESQSISILFLTAAMFNNIVEYNVASFKSCRKILFGGQAASVAHVNKALEVLGPNILINGYGPTETTVFATFFPVTQMYSTRLPIGSPLSNTQVQILNQANKPVGIGLIGEICIGGAGVSLGYLNNVTDSNNKFFSLHVDGCEPSIFYRTGDIGRWLSDGVVEFLGRNDEQVKIRGYRIEPAEIANVLQSHEYIKQAVVIAKDDYDGNKKLIAYVVVNEYYMADAINDWLRLKLPTYMAPSAIVQIDTLPLTDNGKVNIKALPGPDSLLKQNDQYVAPESEPEREIAAIWKQLLGKEKVGVNDHFFQVGGHSLSAVRMIVMLNQQLGIDLSVEEVFNAPVLKDLAFIVQSKKGKTQTSFCDIALSDRVPLSYGQEALWILDQQLDGSVQYHIPCILHFDKPLDTVLLQAALRYILDKHTVLRTVIKSDGDQPYQVLLPSQGWALQVEEDFPWHSFEEYFATTINKPFDLAHDYMMRTVWMPSRSGASRLVFSFHHIVFDEWSRSVFLQDFKAFYQILASGNSPVTTGYPQYQQYATWQRQVLNKEQLEIRFEYWRERLKEIEPLEMPFDFVRPRIALGKGNAETFAIDIATSQLLKDFSRKEDCTMFMVLLTCLNVFLYKYSGQKVICVGTPVANRTHGDSLNMIGFFVNSLPLVCRIDDHSSFLSLLRQVREDTRADLARQDYPFEQIVARAGTERDLSRNPIFQVMYTYQNDVDKTLDNFEVAGVHTSFIFPDSQTTKFDLSFGIYEVADGSLAVEIRYDTGLFKHSTVQLMIEHFGNLLQQVTVQPDQPVSSISLLSEREAICLLEKNNATTKKYRSVDSLQQWIEEQVQQHLTLPAITEGDTTLTYGALNAKANQLAKRLIAEGVGVSTPVLICMDRSIVAVVAILAVVKAGATYVPIDPANPAERINFIAGDTAATIVLTHEKYCNKFSDAQSLTYICIEQFNDHLLEGQADNLSIQTKTTDSVYILYTSGTTGTPKGVVITHQGLINYLQYGIETYGIAGQALSFPLFTNLAFDLTQTSIFLSILSGGQIFVENGDIDRVLQTILKNQQINCLKLTPSHISLIEQDIKSPWLQHVIVGGEALMQNHTDILFSINPQMNIYNEYGPTEATIGCTVAKIQNDFAGVITIGKPISNTCIYILDEKQQPVPTGVKGEIYIAGEGLAREYHNNPTLTNDKFITIPILNKQQRVYRTGDIARWLQDGDIEYLGRRDEQVKIKGYRIEIGEVLYHLLRVEGVENAAVTPIKSVNGYSGLAAYYVAKSNIVDTFIYEILRSHLPEYMVPTIVIRVNEIPLTLNGKVKFDALPAPESIYGTSTAEQAPRNELEAIIAKVWSDLLIGKGGHRTVGIYDSFFALGGDSITAIQVVNRLKEKGYTIRPRHLFEHQTIASLAAVLSESKAPLGKLNVQATGTVAMTPIQQYFFETNPNLPSHYNQDVLVAIDKTVEYETVQQVFDMMLRAHGALRLSYRQEGERYLQQYEDRGIVVQKHDLTHLSAQSLQDAILSISANCHQQIDLHNGQLIQVAWIKTPKQNLYNRLFITIHHLAVDGVSWRIMLADIERALADCLTNGHNTEMPQSATFGEWSNSLQLYAGLAIEQLDYWKHVHASFVPLRTTGQQMNVSRGSVKHVHVEISESLTQYLLTSVHKAYRTEVQDILIAALWLTLSEFTGSRNVVIGLESHGRQELLDVDVSNTVGWFTTLFPVLLNGHNAASLETVIKYIKEDLRAIPDHGRGYGVLKYLSEHDKSKQVLAGQGWDILFNYLGQFDNLFDAKGYLHDADETTAASIGEDVLFVNKLEISASIIKRRLGIYWSYSAIHFHHDVISKLAQQFSSYLEALIVHCISQQTISYTPSDLGLGNKVTPIELDTFLATSTIPNIKKDTVAKIYPLTPLQEGLLFHSFYEKDSLLYIEQFCADLYGYLDVMAFRKVWRLLIEKHTILRTGFLHDVFKLPVQCVYDDIDMPILYEDWSDLATDKQDKKWQSLVDEDKCQSFDMRQPPLSRIKLVKVKEEQYKFLWATHHICLDGWSTMVLIGEMIELYNQFANNQVIGIQQSDAYQSYVKLVGQRNKIADAKYWKDYLSDYKPSVALPFVKKPTSLVLQQSTSNIDVFLDNTFTAQLKTWASEYNITVNTLLQAAWALLLTHYNGTDTALFGYAVSGRSIGLENIEKRVGLYTNILPFFTKINKQQQLSEWLKDIQRNNAISLEHEWITLTEIQAITGQQQDVFNTIFAFENFPVIEPVESTHAITLRNILMQDNTNYPITINASIDDVLSYRISYNTNQVSVKVADAISHHFKYLLYQFILSPSDIVIGKIELTSLQTQQALVQELNPIVKPQAARPSIVDQIRRQCSAQPHLPAIMEGDSVLTYGELDSQSDLIARQLMNTGIAKGSLVALLLGRGIDLIVAQLAILKLGAAYLPIDPAYPKARIAFMINDSKAATLIIGNASIEAVGDILDTANRDTHIQVHILEQLKVSAVLPASTIATAIAEQDLAYVIYTSGSTGTPKGVMVPHQSLLNLVQWHTRAYQVSPSCISTVMAGVGFDASVWEVWPYLCSGSSLHIISDDTKLDASKLHAYINDNQITHCFLTTALAPAFLKHESSKSSTLKYLLTGGDKLPGMDISNLPYQVFNNYGPTEATVVTTFAQVDPSCTEAPAIGKPVDHAAVYLLDSDKRMVPWGAVGEIYIGGDGLAVGYIGNEQQTADSFVQVAIANEVKRLYKTGDIAFWTHTGDLQYLGRTDEQIQLRGNRIEPAEIELALLSYPAIVQAVVVVKNMHENRPQLVAYIIANEVIDESAILLGLAERLPDFMVPSLLVRLDEMPLTPNGKIDREALPNPSPLLQQRKYVAPKGHIEEKLAKIWTRFLSIESIGAGDNFFSLGGHSLIATGLVATINKSFGSSITIADLFRNPTIRSLAKLLNQSNHWMRSIELASNTLAHRPLSYAQERLWFIDQLQGSSGYHIPLVLQLEGNLDIESLEKSLRKIIERHEVLRLTIDQDEEGKLYQRLLSSDNWRLHLHEINEVPSDKDWQSLIDEIVSQPFCLSADYMMRGHLIAQTADIHRLVFVWHHIAFDGWSLSTFLNELSQCYEAYLAGTQPNLPLLKYQYADFANWQRTLLSEDMMEEKLNLWENRLKGLTPLDLPLDFQQADQINLVSKSCIQELSTELSEGLFRLAESEGISVFTLLLTVVKLVLHKYTDREDICIGTPVSNRSGYDFPDNIGFFVNTLPIRTVINNEETFVELLAQVNENMVDALENQQVPFELIVQKVVKERALRRHPLFQVLFTYEDGTDMDSLKMGTVKMVQQFHASHTAKFDLTFGITKIKEKLVVNIEYAKDLFSAETISQLVKCYIFLLQQILNNRFNSLKLLQLLNDEDTNDVLEKLRGEDMPISPDISVQDMLMQKALAYATAPALYQQHEVVTYQALHQEARKIANCLIEQGIKPGDRVGLCLHRTPRLIAAMLAVVYVGACYVPIDTDYPLERIRFISEDSNASIVITEDKYLHLFSATQTCINVSKVNFDIYSDILPQLAYERQNPAYLIYTSGTTGQPKGVVITYHNMLAFLCWAIQEFSATKADIIYATTSISFDLSIFEIFYSLVTGKPLRLLQNGLEIEHWLNHDNNILLNTVPAMIGNLLDRNISLERVSAINMAGEPIPAKVMSGLDIQRIAVRNLYGPSEDTTYSTCYRFSNSKKVLIGKPIANTHVYLFNSSMNVVPNGIPGEIYLGGAGVAAGYLNRPSLTAQRFIPDLFQQGKYMYKTGDLARLLPNGELDYLGRKDDQAKIRGYRVEPKEVQSILETHQDVKAAVCVVQANQDHGNVLVGYVVPAADKVINEAVLTEFLKAKLPAFMVPSRIIEIQEIPRTPNGKVDTNSLPNPTVDAKHKDFVDPSTPTEKALAAIWQELLQLESVSADDNFFTLGGHSLLAAKMITIIQTKMNVKIPLMDFFECNTIATLARLISIASPFREDIHEEYLEVEI